MDLVAEERIEPSLRAADKRSVLHSLATLLAAGSESLQPDEIARVLAEREALASTGVGDEVAIPHGRIAGLDHVIAALAISDQGVDFDAIDRKPVRIFVAILAPEKSTTDHLRALARVSRLLRDAQLREQLLVAKDRKKILAILENDAHSSGS
ncbi:MAG: PTS sugar transporter subunit IIA [Deltaproteobacteria bacterium]|nr:PTS sugar transporter subunit IIA [Deltaproteobacteria bacterium]